MPAVAWSRYLHWRCRTEPGGHGRRAVPRRGRLPRDLRRPCPGRAERASRAFRERIRIRCPRASARCRAPRKHGAVESDSPSARKSFRSFATTPRVPATRPSAPAAWTPIPESLPSRLRRSSHLRHTRRTASRKDRARAWFPLIARSATGPRSLAVGQGVPLTDRPVPVRSAPLVGRPHRACEALLRRLSRKHPDVPSRLHLHFTVTAGSCRLAYMDSLGSHGPCMSRGSIARLPRSLSTLRGRRSLASLARLAFVGWSALAERDGPARTPTRLLVIA